MDLLLAAQQMSANITESTNTVASSSLLQRVFSVFISISKNQKCQELNQTALDDQLI